MTAIGIRAREIRKSFDGRKRVLDGIDLELMPGEVVGLIGPNGAGKTTLTSCLLAFLHIDEGTVTFDGLKPDDLAIRRRTGFVPERLNFGRRITGWAFLRYMALLAGVAKPEADARCRTLLDRLDLTEAAGRPLREYSRGMLQRIALCQALIHQPDFLFLDEPTSGLDPNGVLVVRDLIEEQKRRGAMVLLNSHQLAEVEKVCDRIVFLSGGVIARAETLKHNQRVMLIRFVPTLYDVERVRKITGNTPVDDAVVITVDDDRAVARTIRDLVGSAAEIAEVRPWTPDLEGIFRGGV